jgi:hypothetical protein
MPSPLIYSTALKALKSFHYYLCRLQSGGMGVFMRICAINILSGFIFIAEDWSGAKNNSWIL